jgi:hypothetical protein
MGTRKGKITAKSEVASHQQQQHGAQGTLDSERTGEEENHEGGDRSPLPDIAGVKFILHIS